MRTNVIYIILIGIATTSLVAGSVYGLGKVTSPGVNYPGANTLYALKVTPGVDSNIAHIQVQFKGGYGLGGARVFNVQNIGPGTLSHPNATTLSYDVTAPSIITMNTQVAMILGNINNPSTGGSNEVTFVTQDMSNATLESGKITLNVANSISPDITDSAGKVGINNVTPQKALDVNGDIQLSGNVTSSAAPGSTLAITPPSGGDICIGAC